jgi:hypothetical protein
MVRFGFYNRYEYSVHMCLSFATILLVGDGAEGCVY